MSIRFAQEKDLQQIVALCQQHADYERAHYETKNKIELLSELLFSKAPSLKCVVVEQGRSMVGYATFMKQASTWDADFYLYLDCLFLEENVRGKGIGSQIMEEVKKYAKFENCSTVQWQTPHFNTKAINFYRQMGAIPKTKERFCWNI